ncbi:MAG: hypothetical protein ACJ78Q_07875 [Chloroflexia bacterium]
MDNRQHRQSDLFLVRMWTEQLDQERSEWRGKVQHITSGEVRYFRDWPALVAILTGKKPGPGDAPGGEADPAPKP